MKSKSTVTLLITLILATFSPNLFASGTYSGGTGQPNTPYLIATAADMNEIGENSDDWDDCFLLTADINLIDYNETNFNLIGNAIHPATGNPFTGVFDGNGHTISNFTWKSATIDYVGLFGFIDDPNTEIKNLRLIDPNVQGDLSVGALVGLLQAGEIISCGVEGGDVSGGSYVGGLAGKNDEGTISNCYATGSVTGTGSRIGDLVGSNRDGDISNCYATGTVTGNGDVGGLAGSNIFGTISNCYATGSVTGTGSQAGGLVGWNNGDISNCYAAGPVSGDDDVGGLVGRDNGDISNCYAAGPVSGDVDVGGLAGYTDDGTISNCYATGDVSGTEWVSGLVGHNYKVDIFGSFWDVNTTGQASGVGYDEGEGTVEIYGRTTAQMQTQTTFTDYGWDFVGETINGPNDIWTIHEDQDYPKLVWDLVNFVGWYEVDFVDYAFLAQRWRDDNCGASNDCDGTDLDFSDSIDVADLKIFTNQWLNDTQ